MIYGDNAVIVYTQSSAFIWLVLTAVLYGCETWMLNKRMWAKFQAFQMQCEHRIVSIKWNDCIPNVTVAATSGLDSIINIARAYQLGLFGHIARFSHDVPASAVFPDMDIPDHSWRCSNGRPRTSWLDHICSNIGMSLTHTFSLAQHCSQWRIVAMHRLRIKTDWLRQW